MHVESIKYDISSFTATIGELYFLFSYLIYVGFSNFVKLFKEPLFDFVNFLYFFIALISAHIFVISFCLFSIYIALLFLAS